MSCRLNSRNIDGKASIFLSAFLRPRGSLNDNREPRRSCRKAEDRGTTRWPCHRPIRDATCSETSLGTLTMGGRQLRRGPPSWRKVDSANWQRLDETPVHIGTKSDPIPVVCGPTARSLAIAERRRKTCWVWRESLTERGGFVRRTRTLTRPVSPILSDAIASCSIARRGRKPSMKAVVLVGRWAQGNEEEVRTTLLFTENLIIARLSFG